ncbi:long-chain-fatty-acid--CoA ligase [Deinococcus metallilatus]|uniref:Fatty-acyl-CoA synthase n=1 Tax=Deinococcus metallilatus TaxID=1211322 RepID=A0AAJ5K3X9_9DEIO|nr:acyl-CoA synthetase [Deinococcus metallilatus]MBB5296227.1 fatty-acyl-CoA synthase [Deinococcus metallilatus]QBY09726.1 long-chain-fatty-acid--CoA ligase [Deinococcus metallilatus]RXJ08924.1 long-chain-fatty-acid--CoA ligase [Deinococcus metallilatus]TLK23697.1 long-chain-fatty-acid--CoA ligase [Deinococcus metallilatus]GMA14093.1 acyl-CoA synthetase [Deinococcus metallilatus]
MSGAAGAEARRAARDTLGDALHRSVRRQPHKLALTFGGREWTYAELDAAANRVAHALIEAGLQPGERVAAFGQNSDAYALLWLACTRAGLVHVPVNYALRRSELEYILRQSGARAAFTDPALTDALNEARADLDLALVGTFHGGSEADVLTWAKDEARPVTPPEVELDASALAQLLYTSGTTAAPKGAMMTHAALHSEYLSSIVALDFREEDVVLAALPLYHSAQMHVMLMPQLLVGATIHLIPAPAAEPTLELMERLKVTSFFAPPTVWVSLLRHPDFQTRDLSSLRKLYYGASIMPTPVLTEIMARLPQAGFYNCYGQSELAPLATVLAPHEHAERPSSAGRPVLNVETRVVDENMQDLPPGQPGEIVHRSPHLLVGYWDKPEATEEAFRGGWFHSGDLGVLDEGGYLYVVDRVKDVINTGGVLVAGREVEEALYTHPAVSEVAVIALPDDRWVEAVTAVVVLKPGQSATPDELCDHARTSLAGFKVPKRVHFVESLPRNTAGKILKRELRERFSQQEL